MNSDLNLSKVFLQTIQRGNLEKLKELSKDHDIKDWTRFRHEISGDTGLHIASREGYLNIVEYLCDNWDYPEFKIDVSNKDMKRPLHEAAQFSRSHVIDCLIKRGATVDSLKRADWTALMLSCTKDGKDAEKCVQSLLNAGANVSIKNKDGWIALHVASRVGNVNIIKLLLDKNPKSILAQSNNGRTCLHIAGFHGCVDAVNLCGLCEPKLLEICDSSGSNVLHESVKSNNLDVFKALVNLGVKLDCVDSVGQTVLHIAAIVGNLSVIEYLLTNKLIDVYVKDKFDLTPLAHAQRNNQLRIKDLLLNYM